MAGLPEISQRELRNDNAAIVRRVEAGESFIVTRRGVPVAQLGPVAAASEPLRVARPATRPPVFSEAERVTSGVSTQQVLDELRAERI